jgi:hypothetical protein
MASSIAIWTLGVAIALFLWIFALTLISAFAETLTLPRLAAFFDPSEHQDGWLCAFFVIATAILIASVS